MVVGELPITLMPDHANTHEEGGSDEIDITNLGGYSGDDGEVLFGDGVFRELPVSSVWSPLTNGDPASPELIFLDGDVIMVPFA